MTEHSMTKAHWPHTESSSWRNKTRRHILYSVRSVVMTGRPAPVGRPANGTEGEKIRRSSVRRTPHIFRQEAACEATAVSAATFEVHLRGRHRTKLVKCDKCRCMVRAPNKNAFPKCLLHHRSGKTSSSSSPPRTLWVRAYQR